jgi:predicted dehydrogenase
VPESESRLSRRRFVQASLAAGASLPLAPSLASAASHARVAGANERLSLGVIGTGGMGQWHIRDLVDRAEADNVVVSRVCDVYRRRVDDAAGLIGRPDAGTMEYRAVLDDPDVDAVLIATPDHWHVKIAIEAMEAGKDVFVEKPLSHTIEQALACRDAPAGCCRSGRR